MKKRLWSLIFAWLLGPLSSLWAHEGHVFIETNATGVPLGLEGLKELTQFNQIGGVFGSGSARYDL